MACAGCDAPSWKHGIIFINSFNDAIRGVEIHGKFVNVEEGLHVVGCARESPGLLGVKTVFTLPNSSTDLYLCATHQDVFDSTNCQYIYIVGQDACYY
jgi:hypothetical protein